MSETRTMGYARVSSTGQNLDRQIQALEQYVSTENIVTDKISGKDLDRPGYQELTGRQQRCSFPGKNKPSLLKLSGR